MKGKIVIAVVIVVLVIGALAAIKVSQIKKMIAAKDMFEVPPETVSSVVASQEKWQGLLSAIGSVTAAQGVTVTPEVAGTITEIGFESGAVVSKGDLLVKLDTTLEVAQLSALEAQLDLARLNLERERTLKAQNMVAQSELDAAEATTKQCQGNADAVRATIGKKTIRAPFTGRLGIRQINLGQYLDTGKSIVSLQALTPIYVDFSLPQQNLASLVTGMKVRLTTDTYTNRIFEGTLTAINPDLDQNTRSVGLQATFDNQDQALRPGMYVRVDVLLPEEKDVLVIPMTSVLSAPFGDSVFVIESNVGTNGAPAGLTVRQQFIRTGRTRGDFITVESGLKGGEKIVSAGVFKLRKGMAVLENNELKPGNSVTPHPSDS